ncbi:class I SAM-dependent methyltransferase [Pseudonocardia alni]|jgi:SAM-dependent methyltransferase|uniref:class I SAM-dependent methyltransferase n=1 Tax=Pseudonocardia alni TaxID=33907 RepID=UPI00280B09C2|nr:class I SAM-dependent methyltransferase [Pseudonocardia alni]
MTRSDTWRSVWNDRDDDRADWNGYEATMPPQDYERFTAATAELVRRHLRLGPDDVVGDLGCGTGRIAAHLAPHVRAVHGFDYSETVLRVARERRDLPNVEYHWADLNDLAFEPYGLTQAFSVGGFLYMDSEQAAVGLIRRLHDAGIGVAVLDIPDSRLTDTRDRAYDRSVYDHLAMDAERLTSAFPGAEVHRAELGLDYANAAVRFNLYLPAS